MNQGRADLVAEMFYEIPLNIALKFLGVPDEGAEQLRQFAVAHTLNTWGRPTPQEQLEIAENVGRFWQTAQQILDNMRCLLYTSPSPRARTRYRMPSSDCNNTKQHKTHS